MATLPDETALGMRPTPRPAGGVASYRATTGMEDAGSQALLTAGSEIGKAAEIFAQYQARQDDTNVADIMANQFSPQFRSVYQEYQALQGKDAVDKMPVYVEKLQGLRTAMMEALPNANQKRIFNDESRRRVEMQLDYMAQHANSQNRVWEAGVQRSALTNALQVVADAPTDHNALMNSLEDGRRYIYDYAAKHGGIGIDGLTPQEGFRKFAGDALATKINTLVLSNPEMARDELNNKETRQYIDPKLLPVLDHKVRSELIPYLAKKSASRIVTSAATESLAESMAIPVDEGLRLIAPNDAAASEMVKEAARNGIPVSISIGDPADAIAQQLVAPDEESAKRMALYANKYGGKVNVHVVDRVGKTKTDIQAMLSSMEQRAREDAQRDFPGDPVAEDMYVNQVKGRVGTLVQAQQGLSNQAHGVLITRAAGLDGKPKPQDIGQLLATPEMRQAWSLLTPESKRGFVGPAGILAQNIAEAVGKPAQVNAALEQQAFQRMLLPADDPLAITRPDQLTPLAAYGLTMESHNRLLAKLDALKTPEGRGFQIRAEKLIRGAATIMRSGIVGKMMAETDPAGFADAQLRYQLALDHKVQEYRDAKKDPGLLLDPTKPDYFGKPENILTFLPRTADALASQAAAVRAAERSSGGKIGEPAKPKAAPAAGPKKGDKQKSASGKSMTFNGTNWEYD